MFWKVVQYKTLHDKSLVTWIGKRNELCKKNEEKFLRLYVCMSREFLLKFDETERSLLFQLEVHWKVNNKQTFEETKR